jgi:hypothetical protein
MKEAITPAQVKLVREKLPAEYRDEGFSISVFVELRGHWRACVELADGTPKILEGTH